MLAAITCIVCKRSLGWTFGFRQYSSHSRKQRASYWMHAALLRSMGLTISASCAMGALIDLSAAAYCSRRSSTRTLKSSSRPVAHVMQPWSLAWPAGLQVFLRSALTGWVKVAFSCHVWRAEDVHAADVEPGTASSVVQLDIRKRMPAFMSEEFKWTSKELLV